jgi:putative pyruvate formate lyase activating enzyme
MLKLESDGAHNVNFVTPTHYIPTVREAIINAKALGLSVPIVYNTSSYDTPEALKTLDGLVDIYLPDFKYWDSEIARKYSHATDYPQVAKDAIAEMVRQQPVARFEKMTEVGEKKCAAIEESQEELYLMKKGVIVRQLLLPGLLDDAKQIIRYLYETYGDSIYLSLMSQFTPLPQIQKYPELNRKVTREEYDAYVDYAIDLGVENGFIQEEDVAEESFIPTFDCEGV